MRAANLTINGFATPEQICALTRAVETDNLKAVKLLIEGKVDVNQRNKLMDPPAIIEAPGFGNPILMELLIKVVADLEQVSW